MKKASESTVERLSFYLRLLDEFRDEGLATVSSEALASRAGTTAAQVRKDLSVFGTFGKRGRGYPVTELLGELRQILGLSRPWKVAMVGAGRIGTALLGYEEFHQQGFHIVAVFDSDPAKIGRRSEGLVVRPESELDTALRNEGIRIAILAVPVEAAQALADRATAAGVGAILNFAPTRLDVPPGVALRNVNMAVELEGLSFALANATSEGMGAAAGD